MRIVASLLIGIVLSLPLTARAQEPVEARTGQPFAALPEEMSQFDFWLGTWSIGTAVDKVKRVGKGVAILETYTSGDTEGYSINTFDVTTKTWTQTWVTNKGTYFQLTGKKVGNDIVLVGEAPAPGGGKRLLRLTFANITRDSFQQRYESSTDGGQTWGGLNVVPFTRIK
jgi:hypothetical protein